MPETKIHWKETATGEWIRQFDPIERTANFIMQVNPDLPQIAIAVGGVIPKDSFKDVQTIKNAWIALRHAHPIIGCTIHDLSLSYKIPTKEELQHWVEETVKVDTSGKSAQELVLSAVCPQFPRPAELYILPQQHEIVILQRHEINDGIGSLILLNNMLKAIRSEEGRKTPLTFGDEPTRLSKSITEILKAENPPAELIAEANSIADNCTKERALGLPVKSIDPTIPSKFQRFEYRFSESESSTILKACKAKNITITHASTAAVAQALFEHSGQESGPFCTQFNISLRDLLPAPYDNVDESIGNRFTTFFPVLQITKSTTFDELAEDVKKAYNTWKYKEDNVACQSTMPDIIMERVTAAIASGVQIPAAVVLDSLGIVENYITEPVEDFWLNLGVSVGACCMFLYTVKGCIRLVVCYNSTFHEEDFIKKYTKTIIRYLDEGLGVDL